MLETNPIMTTIRECLKEALLKNTSRNDIEDFLTTLIREIIDIQINLPNRTLRNYFADRLNHLKGLLDREELDITDINELIEEIQPTNKPTMKHLCDGCYKCL